MAVGAAGVDGHYHKLAAVARGNAVDECGVAQGGRVDADFVGPCVEQTGCIVEAADAAAHGEGNVDAVGNALNEARKGVAPLACGADVEVDEFVGPAAGVVFAQFYGVAHVAQLLEVDALDGAPLLHVEAGYDAFAQHSSDSVMRPS